MVVEGKKFQQPGLIELVKLISKDFGNLAQQHVELFKEEIRQDAILAARYTSIAIAGVLIGYTGLIFFGFFLVFLLALVVPLWLSALIVTILFFITAIASFLIIKNILHKLQHDSISETQRTMEESKKWLQELK